ncbi:MAG TPA: ABC transporter permease [Methylomirabilota bacterium]|nr:ABC transporter permease [Methylomirabilota bacterium]
MATTTSALTVAASEQRPRRARGAVAQAAREFARDRQAMLGLFIIAIVGAAALAAPLISPWDPLSASGVERLAPIGTPGHVLGTDEQGRDILSRLIWGGRASLLVGILPTVTAGVLALGLGLLAGFVGGVLDHAIMRALDVFFAFPLVLLAIAIVGVIGPGMGNQMFALAVVLVPYSTRVVRTATLSIKPLEFVEAARALGAGGGRLIARHLLPNVLPPLLVYTSTLVGMMIVASAGLSFLGLGVQPPTPDWGVMVGNGRLVLYRAAHVATIPGVVIVVTALAFNFVGDGLREALDPRARR